VNYGHADKIARIIAGTSTSPVAVKPPPPIDPALWQREDVRRVLAAHDIAALYQVLKDDAGLTQRQMAELTGQSQSEVSEILQGRRVLAYDLLVRIAQGLRIPRELMGLGTGASGGAAVSADDAYSEVDGSRDPEVEEEMRRRALLAATSLAALGRVVTNMGELAELALPRAGDELLPARLTMAHVQAIEAVTERLRNVARQHGGQAEVFGAAARHYIRWMDVPATEAVKARLGCALADLYTEAGWTFYDSGKSGAGYFTRALRLADEAGDGFGISNAAWHAGVTLVRSGHPNDALKCFQFGQFSLEGSLVKKSKPATLYTDDPRVPTLTARLNRNSATAYALMDYPEKAVSHLAEAHNGWTPRDAFDSAGMDIATAGIQLDLNHLEVAQQFAARAACTYGDMHGLWRTQAELMLAEVHVRSGEHRGLMLARRAIDAVSVLESVSVRQERLIPLVRALDSRPGSDYRELARMARKVAATRA